MKDITDKKVPRVFLDTNIILDYLYFRGKEALAAEYILDACIHGDIECWIAAHSLCNIFYIIRKDFSDEERTSIILNLCAICRTQPVSGKTIEDAISAGFSPDLEDALQMECATECGADYLLTRDEKGFTGSPVTVILPHELIHELEL